MSKIDGPLHLSAGQGFCDKYARQSRHVLNSAIVFQKFARHISDETSGDRREERRSLKPCHKTRIPRPFLPSDGPDSLPAGLHSTPGNVDVVLDCSNLVLNFGLPFTP
jgi:hypothetical protein